MNIQIKETSAPILFLCVFAMPSDQLSSCRAEHLKALSRLLNLDLFLPRDLAVYFYFLQQ
ncbi:hypothetical protein A2Y47_00660 [Candidatus Giovannonibacteria bacterium RIFCSPLOWO2_12_43_8]|uniref:Uncharacterized protein n=1 Tax=Candidatus Giovannonibacteria bacterium RIFCSPLOWO2_12_43_8 TaxID=1798361 RepID=A0A1F5Y4J9_9BACT|nr:MAG: hypothetical protein A2Y47_00660 [Candidatus Giovannonibacteria bacterium RIFCSPLOWO2_12_43_8]